MVPMCSVTAENSTVFTFIDTSGSPYKKVTASLSILASIVLKLIFYDFHQTKGSRKGNGVSPPFSDHLDIVGLGIH